MRASFLDSIDWQQPWLLPLHAAVAPIMHAADWRRAINTEAAAKGLRNRQGMPIHFVPQADLPADTAYESFIHATGAVPTRDNPPVTGLGASDVARPLLRPLHDEVMH